MTNSAEYQETLTVYTSQLQNLFVLPEGEATIGVKTRSANTLPTELLAERTEALAETSQSLGEMTASYLKSDDRNQREAAEMKLLAQAIAELELVQELLKRSEEETEENSEAVITRSSRSAGIEVDNLIDVLEAPMDEGLSSSLMGEPKLRSATKRSTDPKQARTELSDMVEMSLADICERASSVGWGAATNLLLMDAAVLRQGIEFVSKDAAQLLDQIMAGVGGLMLRLLKTAIRLLAQAYNWIRALIGKDIEQEARQQVGGWLEGLKQEQPQGKANEGLFGKVVNKVYRSDVLQSDIQSWLQATQTDVNQINQATDRVELLAKKYQTKTDQVKKLLTAIAFIKRLPAVATPQGQVITSAVTLGVLVYVLYTGHDHVRDGRIVLNEKFSFNIPDRVVGIRETVQQALGVVEPPVSPATTG